MDLVKKISEAKDKLWNDMSLSESEYNKLSKEVVADIVKLNNIKEGFSFTFTSPYQQYKEHIGKKAKVIEICTSPDIVHWESAPLYKILFEDGVEIHAHAEEVKPELIGK